MGRVERTLSGSSESSIVSVGSLNLLLCRICVDFFFGSQFVSYCFQMEKIVNHSF
jgi:hypothetical protein